MTDDTKKNLDSMIEIVVCNVSPLGLKISYLDGFSKIWDLGSVWTKYI